MNSFAEDRRSGSSVVAAGFLSELERWAAMDRSATAVAFRDALYAWLREAQTAHPTLALIHQLAARAFDIANTSVSRGEAPPDARAHLAASCAAERADLAKACEGVARIAASLLEARGGWIATLSASAAVRAAILEAKRAGNEPRVLLGEGRPGLEGRAMAESLAQAGVPVWLVVDAALPMLISQAAAVWLGSDAVTEQGILNKVGSLAAALAAREHGVPVWALAERRKFIPAGTPALRIVELPPAEVWEAPAPGVQPRNVYFELVPMALLRGIVVEDGVLGATEAAVTARERALPDELAASPVA